MFGWLWLIPALPLAGFAALILLAGLVGAYHLGRRSPASDEKGS